MIFPVIGICMWNFDFLLGFFVGYRISNFDTRIYIYTYMLHEFVFDLNVYIFSISYRTGLKRIHC